MKTLEIPPPQEIGDIYYTMVTRAAPITQDALCAAALPHWFPQSLFEELFTNLQATNQARAQEFLLFLEQLPILTQLRSRPARALKGRQDDLPVDELGGELPAHPNALTHAPSVTNMSMALFALDDQARRVILRWWIEHKSMSFLAAHAVAKEFWTAHPDRNTFVQDRNLLYHTFFTNLNEAITALILRFRTYEAVRAFPAIERLLETAKEAQELLLLLEKAKSTTEGGPPPATPNTPTLAEVDDLILHMRIRLAQLRGDWDEARAALPKLRDNNHHLRMELRPFAARAFAHQFVYEAKQGLKSGSFVQAIHEAESAIRQLKKVSKLPFVRDLYEPELTDTYLLLGDIYTDFAADLRGPRSLWYPPPHRWQWLISIPQFISSLPIALYLLMRVGWQHWRFEMTPVLASLDWMVAKLYVNAVRYYNEAKKVMSVGEEVRGHSTVDEKLANIYLALGNPSLAEEHLTLLRQRLKGNLSPYGQAITNTQLAEAKLRNGKAQEALDLLQTSVATLENYSDWEEAIPARELKAEAHFAVGETSQAIKEFLTCIQYYQEDGRIEDATSVAERVEALVAATSASHTKVISRAEVETQIDAILPLRRYGIAFRHTIWRSFNIAVLILLAITFCLAPWLVFNIDQSYELMPRSASSFDINEIRQALLPQINSENPIGTDPNGIPRPRLDIAIGDFTQVAQLAQVIPFSSLERPSQVVANVAVGVIAFFFLMAFVIGVLIIHFTPLELIERQAQRSEIEIDKDGLRVGRPGEENRLPFDQVQRLIPANIKWSTTPLPDFSALYLVTNGGHEAVKGNTHWYQSLSRRIHSGVDPSRTVNADFSILRSLSFALFCLAFGLLLLLAAGLSWLPDALRGLQIGPYLTTDLHPYLMLGLMLAPLNWFVVRPLRMAYVTNSHSRLPLIFWMLGVGLLLLQVINGFLDPMSPPDQLLFNWFHLPAINLYMPVVSLTLLVLPGLFWWFAREIDGNLVYRPRWRYGNAVVGGIVLLAIGTLLWQEMITYHAFVQGLAAHRSSTDAELQSGELRIGDLSSEVDVELAKNNPIIDAYELAITRSQYPSLRTLLNTLLHPLIQHTWQSRIAKLANGNQVAVLTQLALRQQDDALLTAALTEHEDHLELYYWRALIHQSQNEYISAIADLHALFEKNDRQKGQWPASSTSADYLHAANIALGWLYYYQENDVHALLQFSNARSFAQSEFTTAKAAQMSTDAVAGMAAVLFNMKHYMDTLSLVQDEIEKSSKRTSDLAGTSTSEYTATADARLYYLLGASYWRLGNEKARTDRCEEYTKARQAFADAIASHHAHHPELLVEDASVSDSQLAAYYRLQGTLNWLLDDVHCEWVANDVAQTVEARTQSLQTAVDNFGLAVRYDPLNADYWQMSARMRTARWVFTGQAPIRRQTSPNEWLKPIFDDLEHAIAIQPSDMKTDGEDYRPNEWLQNMATLVRTDINYALCSGNRENAELLNTLLISSTRMMTDTTLYDATLKQILTNTVSLEYEPLPQVLRESLSPIVYACGDEGRTTLFVFDPKTDETKEVANSTCENMEAAWSPDGKSFIYHHGCDVYDLPHNLFIADVTSTQGEDRPFLPDLSAAMREAAFSPNGEQVVYRRDPYTTSLGVDGMLWIANADGGDAELLPVKGRAPVWSPDGDYLAYMSRRTGRWNIYAYDIERNQEKLLTNSCVERSFRFPTWSPDGNYVAYGLQDFSGTWAIALQGGEPIFLIQGAARPVWVDDLRLIFNLDIGGVYVADLAAEAFPAVPDDTQKLNTDDEAINDGWGEPGSSGPDCDNLTAEERTFVVPTASAEVERHLLIPFGYGADARGVKDMTTP